VSRPRRAAPAPPPPKPASTVAAWQAAVVLYPFASGVPTDVATALLFQHVSYHVQMGFKKVVHYTQVPSRAAPLQRPVRVAQLQGRREPALPENTSG